MAGASVRTIQYVTFGTYYRPQAPTPGPNAGDMRRLTYFVKGKWVNGSIVARHPYGEEATLSSASDAHDYFAKLICRNIAAVCEALEIANPNSILWVPIPSSQVTRESKTTGRWAGREVAQRLAKAGFGQMCLAAVHLKSADGKTDGVRLTMEQCLALLDVVQRPRPFSRVVYLDDVITWGNHLAALDHALGCPSGAAALALARTDHQECDAFEPRTGVVEIIAPHGPFKQFTVTMR